MSAFIEFTNVGLATDSEGQLVQNDGRFSITDLDAVKSTQDPVHCSCEHCGHKWSWVRFPRDRLGERTAYAFDVANRKRETDYHSVHQVVGRIMDMAIDGLGGAEGSEGEEALKATVVVLWEQHKVTDAFTLRAGLRAFNHAFGYMAKCCHDNIAEKLKEEGTTPEECGIAGPEALRLEFAEYDCVDGDVANNDKMMKWFNIAADKPTIPVS